MATKWTDFPGRNDSAEVVRYYTGVDRWCNDQWREGRFDVFRFARFARERMGMTTGEAACFFARVLDENGMHATEYKVAGMQSALHTILRRPR